MRLIFIVSKILGVIKGVNHVIRWFTPLFAEREVCEPNSRISLYINFLYVLTNHQCSIFVAVFWLPFDNSSDYRLKARSLSFGGYKSTEKRTNHQTFVQGNRIWIYRRSLKEYSNAWKSMMFFFVHVACILYIYIWFQAT